MLNYEDKYKEISKEFDAKLRLLLDIEIKLRTPIEEEYELNIAPANAIYTKKMNKVKKIYDKKRKIIDQWKQAKLLKINHTNS
jgi:hypothetical protein